MTRRPFAWAIAAVLTYGATSAAAQTRGTPAPRSTGSSSTTEGLSFRPFFVVTAQRFTAQTTFEAAFGQPLQPFFGGGLNITQDDRAYFELSASRFKKTGQQAFYSAGQIFQLGIPMTATVTPFEMTAGYRFHRRPPRVPPRIPPRGRPRVSGPERFIPYVGGGVGLYRFEQTSQFATDEEKVDTRHAGVIVEGGVEMRVHRWVGVGFNVHYTHVPGILGEGGISKDAGESDLGGIAAGVKIVVGR